MHNLKRCIFVFLTFFFITYVINQSLAQNPFEEIPEEELLQIKFAGYMESVDSPGIQLRKLVNDVQMKHGEAMLFCDSAYFYTADNRVTAMGNVIIEQADSVQISCQKMFFEGAKNQAQLIGNAILTDGKTQVSSQQLNYNTETKYGYYTTGGEIIQEETVLTSKEAHYYGNTKDVIYRDSVLLINPEYQLTTDSLHHNLDTEIAIYFGPSEVITETNTIVGDGGYFDMKSNLAHFGNRTTIYGEQYVEADSIYYSQDLFRTFGDAIVQKDSLYVEADSVFYNQQTNDGEAYGNAYVNNKGAEIMGEQLFFNDESGEGKAYGGAYYYDEQMEVEGDTILFNRNTGEAEVVGRAYVVNEGNETGGNQIIFNNETGEGLIIGDAVTIDENGAKLKADTLQFNDQTGKGFALGAVFFKDTAQNIILIGNDLIYDETTDFIQIADEPLLVYILEDDSLYIKADTLQSFTESLTDSTQTENSRSFIAYNNVKVFKNDMQSVCDSLYYNGVDSTFYFYQKPVVWVNDSQLSGDTIELHTTNNELDSVKLINQAFIGTITYPELYDQVKGKYVKGNFVDGNLQDMLIYQNAESIYFIKDDNNAFNAVNEAKCDTMQIVFSEDQQVRQIKFISEADATLSPIDKVQPFQIKLDGFNWYKNLRPKLKDFDFSSFSPLTQQQ